MKRASLFLISIALLSLAACGQKHEPVQEAAVNNSVAAPAPVPMAQSGGQSFANTAAASDMFEVEASKLAQSNGASPAVQKFAQSMIKGHTDSTAKLKAAAGAATPVIVPHTTLNPAQQQLLDDLKGKKGAQFDSAYAQAQVQAHEQALGALRAYSTDGEVPSLKKFAADLVPIVTGHLNMAKGLKS